jgi:hypothetical protein
MLQRSFSLCALTIHRVPRHHREQEERTVIGGSVAKTTAATPPRPRRQIIDLVEIGSGQPLLCVHTGEGPTASTDNHLRAAFKTRRIMAGWHVIQPSTRPPGCVSMSAKAEF